MPEKAQWKIHVAEDIMLPDTYFSENVLTFCPEFSLAQMFVVVVLLHFEGIECS